MVKKHNVLKTSKGFIMRVKKKKAMDKLKVARMTVEDKLRHSLFNICFGIILCIVGFVLPVVSLKVYIIFLFAGAFTLQMGVSEFSRMLIKITRRNK